MVGWKARAMAPMLSGMSRKPHTERDHAMLAQNADSRDDAEGRVAPLPGREPRSGPAQFAAAVAICGTLVLLVIMFGWWALLAGPAYLAAVAILMLLLAHSSLRQPLRMLLAVGIATASIAVLVAVIQLVALV